MNLFVRRSVRLSEPRQTATLAEIPLPSRLFIPLRQHSGPEAEPVVEVGQSVAEGQLIGQAPPGQPESAPVHAPCAGKIVELVNKPLIGGKMGLCLVLEPSGPPSPLPRELAESDHEPDREHLFAAIREGGVVAAGVRALPLSRDVSPYSDGTGPGLEAGSEVKSIYTLIVSALDREPTLAHQGHLARTNHPLLAVGLNAIQILSNSARTVVVGDLETDAKALSGLLRYGHRSSLNLDGGRYPNGLKQVVVKAVTGDEIPLPLDDPREVGVLYVRLEEAFWAGVAVATGRPQFGKWLTVTDPEGRRKVAMVPLGTPVGHILASLDLAPAEGGKVIIGGLLTGHTVYDLETPITKQMGGVIVLRPDQVKHFEPQPCINCGLCVEACPVRIVPGQLSKYCEYGRFEEAEAHDLALCVECGLCAYVCPAKRPMIHYFRHAKEELLAGRAE